MPKNEQDDFAALRLLRNPVRRRIMNAVQSEAIPIRQLAGRLGIGTGGMYHHLRKLQAVGLVALTRQGPYVVVCSRDTPTKNPSPLPAQLVAAAVAKFPGSTFAVLKDIVGLPDHVVRYHGQRLALQGIIEIRGFPATLWPVSQPPRGENPQ